MAKSDLATLVVNLELQSQRYQQGFDQATARLNRFHKETSDSLKKIGELFAVALSADAVLEFAKSTIDASADLELFSKASGIAVEQLSALQFAAKAGGVGTDALNTSLKKLNISISEAAGNAKSDAATAFSLLGVSVRDSNGHLKDANTVFGQVADKFASTADGANKVQLAVALFGKAGEALIPTLDKGSAGLQELADKAKAAGAIISEDTAKAALEFREKAELLKTTLIDGLGAEIEKQLLPTLNNLVDNFNATAKAAEAIKPIADVMVGAFRLVLSALIEAGVEIKTVKDSFIALANIGDAALHGHFAEVARLWKESNDQNDATIKAGQDAAAALYRQGGDEALGEVKVTAKKMQEQLGSLAGAKEFNAALQTLKDFAAQIGAEANKLDAGTLAATKYKLQHGALAEAIEKTGDASKKTVDQILGFAKQIDLEHVSKSVADLKSQLSALSGDAAGAALEKFDAGTKTLRDTLQSLGDQAPKDAQAVIDALRQQTVYLQAYNTLQVQSGRIRQEGADAEQKISDQVANHQLTTREGELALQKVRADTLAQLQGIKNGEDSVAAASNNPALIQGAKAFGAELDHLKAQNIDPLINSVRSGLESAFANNFSDLITGAKSFGQAITGLLQDVEKQFANLVAKNFAESLFGAASGTSSGGSLGGLAPALASLFGGGAHAGGGTIPSGTIGLVGENGPELVMGAAGGTNVIPNGQIGGGGQHNTFNFVIQSQNGQISRQSQSQVAAAAARSIGQVNARRLA